MTKVTVEAFAEGCRRLAPGGWREIRGCVLAAAGASKRSVKRMLAEGCSRKLIECTFNHRHMTMMLSTFDSEDFDWKDARVIAEVYAGMLARSLEKQYPERQFVVEVYEEEGDITVVCYQAEPEDVEAKGLEGGCTDAGSREGEQKGNVNAEQANL